MKAIDTSPKIFLTDCGVVLFTYLGLAEYRDTVCTAWQTAVELLDGLMVSGTMVRPPGEVPDSVCASELAQYLWDSGRS